MLVTSLLAAAVIISVIVWVRLRAAFKIFRVSMPELNVHDLESLPTVSLCIPARNETQAMTACLENALLSSYPKLEIIVLDDESHDNTGHLIKSFAHAGVRFVEGSPLPDGWLGKNHALRGLLRESSGSLILFADVDTRFSVQSISQMVAYMRSKNASMVSVLPYRYNTLRASVILATFRHFWNIIGHTSMRPAAASSAWMVKREVLESEFNSLEMLASDVRPELTIAQRLNEQGLYRFIVADSNLGVSYDKELTSQYETGIRVYYPDFGLSGVVMRIGGLVLMMAPYLMVVLGVLMQQYIVALSSFLVTILISVLNAWYLGVLRSNNYGITSLCLPFLMLREVSLLAASVVLYKRRKVTWKGRPVSIRDAS